MPSGPPGSARSVATALPVLLRPGERWTEALRTFVGMALDTVALRTTQLLVDGTLMPGPADLPRLRASASPYQVPELRNDPGRFFDFLAAPPRFTMKERGRRERAGGVVIEREFASEYVPYARSAGNDGANPEDATIVAEHWMHDREGPAATVVALHGVAMGSPRLGGLALLTSHWFERGLDVALLRLPFLRLLAARWGRISCYVFPSTDVGRLNETVREAVHEVRVVTAWLRAETRAPVGLLGLSLGGYVAALMAGLTDEFDFVIPIAAPVCIGDLAWRFFARSRHYAPATSPPPSRDEVRDFYRVHSPLTHRLRVPRERVLILAGRGDRIVPAEHPLALWRHWGEPDIYWFGGSHLIPFGRDHVVARIVRHLGALGIV